VQNSWVRRGGGIRVQRFQGAICDIKMKLEAWGVEEGEIIKGRSERADVGGWGQPRKRPRQGKEKRKEGGLPKIWLPKVPNGGWLNGGRKKHKK